jgi:MscS family membrane protein
MRTLSVFVLIGGVSLAQTPAAPVKDPLGRDNPQSAIFQFLETCHARNYTKAEQYLDLRKLTPTDRAKNGAELARDLEDLLDDTPFDITMLSLDPEGDTSDGLTAARDRLDSFQINGQTVELEMERVELRPGSRVWLVSADSLPLIVKAHQLVGETPFEKKLPQPLVTMEVLDTPVWRWIALLVAALILWSAATLVATAVLAGLRRVKRAQALHGPLRVALAATGFRAAIEFAPPAAISRLFLERAVGMIFILALAWAAAIVIDMFADRWNSRLDPRMQAMSYSVLPLGRQVLKLLLFVIAILSVVSAWGYNTSTILAGLGVGGLAVALAAQKTIENLFGGIAVIGDRPVLVGDFCRFGDRQGTVSHIGLRSTRIRTLDRTLISVPNGQFSAMELENFSARDKIWFHPTFNLRRETTTEQLSKVLSSIEQILRCHPKVEPGNLPVRFIGLGASSLNIEVSVYILTSDSDEFLKLQQELLLQLMQAVEQAGTALAA